MTFKTRVLLVEDSSDDAELIYRELNRADFESDLHLVETLADLESELISGNWDIVISDYRLKGFNALNVIELLHQMGSSMPLILISGGLDDFSALAALSKGAVDYVPKDHLEALGPAVSRVLDT